MTDALDRLRSGLADAQEAAEFALELEQPYHEGSNTFEIRYEWVRLTKRTGSGQRPSSSSFIPGAPSPREVLRQAEKLRDAATLLDDALNGGGPEPDLRSVCTELAELLAGIYAEEEP